MMRSVAVSFEWRGRLRSSEDRGIRWPPAPPGVAGSDLWRERFRLFRNDARRRGLAVEITPLQFVALRTLECTYCGGVGGTIDRRDSAGGYTEKNCRPCCRPCNTAKSTLTEAQWLRVIGPAVRSHGRGNVWPRDAAPPRRRAARLEASIGGAL